jgi:hypothetical protein
MLRSIVCGFLLLRLVSGQDLRVAPMSIRQLEQSEAKVFRQNTGGQQPPSAVAKEKKKRRKGLWIGLAVAGAATVAALIAVDKRLGNEGHGIFR